MALGSEAVARGVGHRHRPRRPPLRPGAGRRPGRRHHATGIDVIDIGRVPTPMTYFAAHELGTDSCVSVTGSHNPPEYNGLKMVLGGQTLYGEMIQDLRRRIASADFCEGAAWCATPACARPTSTASSATSSWRGR
jgi:phosphomannomutase/phosphoglucomutase